MKVTRLSAQGWRNLADFTFRPSTRVTVLSGENGQGKTNLVEAIYYLATLRSFRTQDVADLIRHDAARATVDADVEVGPLVHDLRLDLERDARRRLHLDGKMVRGAAAVFGTIRAVLFEPDHLMLLRAAPAVRRRTLDLAVFGVDRRFWAEALAYSRVLRSRNAVLRRGIGDTRLLETYDEGLAKAGARVVMRRRTLVAELARRFTPMFGSITRTGRCATLAYRSAETVAAAPDEAAVEGALLAGLAAGRDLDLRRRRTGFGPHTDDLEVALDGRLAREHASKGQTRALILALKLAERALVEDVAGEPPVLLLDDVAGELDGPRREFLFDTIAGCRSQTVITVTEANQVPDLAERADVTVAAGAFRFTGRP